MQWQQQEPVFQRHYRRPPSRGGQGKGPKQRNDRQSEPGARADDRLCRQKNGKHGEARHRRHQCRDIVFPTQRFPVTVDRHRPGGRKKCQAIEQGCKVVPVGKKANRLHRIVDVKETQGAGRTLSDLAEPKKDAGEAHSKKDKGQQASLAKIE